MSITNEVENAIEDFWLRRFDSAQKLSQSFFNLHNTKLPLRGEFCVVADATDFVTQNLVEMVELVTTLTSPSLGSVATPARLFCVLAKHDSALQFSQKKWMWRWEELVKRSLVAVAPCSA